MSRRRTEPDRLSIETACDIVGMSANHYRDWVDAGLLESSEGLGLSARDVVLAAILSLLVEELRGRDDGKHAWYDVRKALSSRALMGQLDVVYDRPSRSAVLVDNDADLANASRCRRPVQVVELTNEIERVRRAAEKEVHLAQSSLPSRKKSARPETA